MHGLSNPRLIWVVCIACNGYFHAHKYVDSVIVNTPRRDARTFRTLQQHNRDMSLCLCVPLHRTPNAVNPNCKQSHRRITLRRPPYIVSQVYCQCVNDVHDDDEEDDADDDDGIMMGEKRTQSLSIQI